MVARPPTPLQQAIEETLRDLRPGEVVSYGFVAEQAGYPGRARAVGTFLATHHDAPNWWRVVAANGELRAPRRALQAERLAAEGVAVVDGRVDRAGRNGPNGSRGPRAPRSPERRHHLGGDVLE
jgi:methylated-DNA-protein-cysteine methyltransferase related protein